MPFFLSHLKILIAPFSSKQQCICSMRLLKSSPFILLYLGSIGIDHVMSELCKKGTILHRGSYMSAHVLLNLLNELRKRDKCEAC